MSGRNHHARIGLLAQAILTAKPSQAHNASIIISASTDATYCGYIGTPGSIVFSAEALGLDDNQPFTGALAWATDPVGKLTFEGISQGSFTGSITYAWEFDNGGEGLGGPTGPIYAEQVIYEGLYPNVQEALDALFYKAPQITEFVANPNIVEIGQTITNVDLTWAFNKDMETASISGGIGDVALDGGNTNVAGSWTTNQSWTLTAGDGTNTVTATASLLFENMIYWGVSTLDVLTSPAIIDLGNSAFGTSITRTITYDCSEGGVYPYIAYPASFGLPSLVIVGGFAFTSYTVNTQSFTNASGHTSSYNVIRFNFTQTGSAITVQWNQ